jgi:hypothetical protein
MLGIRLVVNILLQWLDNIHDMSFGVLVVGVVVVVVVVGEKKEVQEEKSLGAICRFVVNFVDLI